MPEEEKKEEKPDQEMNDDQFRDVNHMARKSKRNKTPVSPRWHMSFSLKMFQ